MPKDPLEIGALWRKDDTGKGPWFSGTLDLEQLLQLTGGATGKVSLVAFSTKKQKDTQPDFVVLLSRKSAAQVPERVPVEREPPRTALDDDDVVF